MGARAKLALGAVAALAIVAVVVLALRGGAAPASGVADKAVVAPPMENASLVPLPAEKPVVVPPAANPPAPASPPTEAASTDKPARARRHHGETDKVDPLHRKIDVPGDPATPAELKNPFAAP